MYIAIRSDDDAQTWNWRRSPVIPTTCVAPTSLSRRLPIIWNLYNWAGKKRFVSLKFEWFQLKLIPSKTECLLIVTKLQREQFLNNFPCLLLGRDTNPSTSAKKFGVVFDSSLKFRKHISQACKACFYHIRDLRRI